jgi:AAA domain
MTELNKDSVVSRRDKRTRDRPIPKTNGAMGGDGMMDGGAASSEIVDPKIITLLADWVTRELPSPDYISGSWLTTTSRVMFVAPTGLGKTMWGVGLAIALAAGVGFLNWAPRRKCRVLYIDGEMSRRLMKRRLVEEVHRFGSMPDMHILNHEDIENLQPLSTEVGRKQIETFIAARGSFDLILFDNIMSLIGGDMKDEESWRNTIPWQHSLTKRNIGQIWLHHMGHDTTRSYGTKTREWQMDTVILAESVARDDTDVSFKITFTKARERTPETRDDFSDKNIWLVGDKWNSDGAIAAAKKKLTDKEQSFYKALVDATIGNEANKMFGHPAASLKLWRSYCVRLGLITGHEQQGDNVVSLRNDPEYKRGITKFNDYKLALISKGWIACNETMAWVMS